MTLQRKLQMVKTSLSIQADDVTLDGELYVYLDMAAMEILNWLYINKPSKRSEVKNVPERYEIVQIQAVVNGYSHKGAEGEIVHNENGINRQFVYDDMVSYIRHRVFQLI